MGTTGFGGLKEWEVEKKDSVAIRTKGEVWSLKPPVRIGIVLWVDLFPLPPPNILKSYPLEPQNVTLFGHRVFTWVIKLKWGY